jgi:CelD/BcsL family acetyltransferase involved in cellulose biosynthesis
VTSRKHGRGGPLLITSEAFEALEPEWRTLHARASGHPFAHPAWFATWLRHYGTACAPVFLSFRTDADDSELVGVVALDARSEEAESLGAPDVQDYAAPLVLPGYEAAVAAGLCEWLDEDLTPAAVLWGLPAAAPFTSACPDAADGMGWACAEEPEAVCPALALPATFEEYVAALPKHERHELRRKLRNLEAAGTVAFESFTTPEAALGQLETFATLMRASRPDKEAFLTPAREAFFRNLVAAFTAEGLLALERLTLDGVPVAALLTFRTAGTAWLYNSGYDPAFASLAVGLLSKALSIREAIARGDHTFDFLRGDEEYKRRLGGEPRPVVTLRLARR